MTAVALDRRLPGPWTVPLTLGLLEGRRIVLHPLALVGLVLTVLPMVVVGDNGPRDAFDVLVVGPNSYYGVLVYFAAWSVASRDRRSHTRELLAATPVLATGRVAGLCVGALAPAAVCVAVVLSIHAMQSLRDLYVVAPEPGHLAQPVVTVLGGALLGIMVARLTGVPGVALLVMIAMVLFNAWISEHDAAVQPLGTYVSWATWALHPHWAGMEPGSPAWHVAYLAVLCALAACGSFLREARRPWRVVALGAGLTALAVVPALAQLP